MAVFPRTDVFGYQIQLRDWDIKGVGAGIFDFDIVLDNPVQLDFVNNVKYADTVGDMNDIISFFQVRETFDFFSLFSF